MSSGAISPAVGNSPVFIPGIVGGAITPPSGDFFLLEDGFKFLLESGDSLLLET